MRNSSDGGNAEEVLCLEVDNTLPDRKSSLTTAQISEPIRLEKVPVKRVSFSNTHSVINDCGEEVLPVRHRDSITSASTDSSEDSTSSGEGRSGAMSHRSSKLRAKLPVTTGTTKHLSEMVQTSLDGGSIISMDSSTEEWTPSIQKEVAERRKSAPLCADMYPDRRSEGHVVKDYRSMSQTVAPYDQLAMMSPSSPVPNSQFQFKGSKGIMSPPPQKGTRTHSRGSSISSLESSDSYQGYVMSPTTPSGEYIYEEQNQSPWSKMDDNNYLKGQGQLTKQGPPTAQKPASIKKSRPMSGSSTGSVDMGHRRNASKSSLESVEEIPKESEDHGFMGPIPVCSPVPPRTSPVPPRISPVPTKTVIPSPPILQQNQNWPQSLPTTPTMLQSVPRTPNQHPRVDLTQSHMTMGPYSAPATPQPLSPATTSTIGCLSPRLSGHRSSISKAVTPPVVPSTPPPNPPALVPPAPRNPAASIKTHKKRPSGGNIVVNGNQALSGSPGAQYPDIVATHRSNQTTATESQGHDHGTSNSEDANCAFMAELNQHMHMSSTSSPDGTVQQPDSRIPPQTLPKPNDQRVNGNTSACPMDYNSSYPHFYSHSVIPDIANRPPPSSNQQSKKQIPPPPPKRNENTKLSTSISSRTSAVDISDVPNEINHIDPIYGNCEGILDISDLPPPPPELLEDFTGEGQSYYEGQGHGSQRSGKLIAPPPPPPPKRNKETQLSS